MGEKFKSSATIIPLDQAVGKVLAHDITEITPGRFKGAAFKKGYIIRQEDLPHLRKIGKNHIFALELVPGEVHEDEAALRLARVLAGPGTRFDEPPAEGKVSIRAARRGLLNVNADALFRLNLIRHMCCASRHSNDLVEKGDIVAAERVIPLIVSEELLEEAVSLAAAAGGIFSVKPLSPLKAGLVVTGNEVFHGLVEDRFFPLLKEKLRGYDCELIETIRCPDIRERIVEAIHDLLAAGAELILVGGGMSVDPDDVSRTAIAEAGAKDVVYGTPVLPGAMFLYGRFGSVPVLGLPACVLFYRATVFDVLFPRVLAGEIITREDLAALGHGGLCLNCPECRYPNCAFGK